MSAPELSRRDRRRARISLRLSRVSFDLGCLVCSIGGGLPLAAVVPWMLRQAWLGFRGPSS